MTDTPDLSIVIWRKSSRSGTEGGDCVEVGLVWRKSSRSGGEGGECVEVAPAPNTLTAIRDSKNPAGPAHTFSAPAWSAFLTAAKQGAFDRS